MFNVWQPFCSPFDATQVSQGLKACDLTLQYHLYNKREGHENKRNDHQLRNPLIVTQILLNRTIGEV